MILFIDTSTSYPIVSIIENNNIKAMFNKKIDTDISVSIFSILDRASHDSEARLSVLCKLDNRI